MLAPAASRSMTSPLRTPSDSAWPTPMMLMPPPSTTSPTMAQTFEVPTSKPTMICSFARMRVPPFNSQTPPARPVTPQPHPRRTTQPRHGAALVHADEKFLRQHSPHLDASHHRQHLQIASDSIEVQRQQILSDRYARKRRDLRRRQHSVVF